ncbi:hypothetical protein EDC04DRAFT_2904205 [Pisolithus marmoratus]|nr:hypothetical protein EDC04DRAFT_2904205 [Pisolithus marmoratus]
MSVLYGYELRKEKVGLEDFDSKTVGRYESDSDDVDEPLTVPRVPEYDDGPVIENEYELGRIIRAARKSEVSRHLLSTSKDQEIGEETSQGCGRGVGRGAEHPEMHYDAMKEVRAKGAAFHQFSADEHQEAADGSTGEETVKTRKELGNSGSRPLKKRKREVENSATFGTKTDLAKSCFPSERRVPKPSSPEPKRAVVRSQATMTVYADTLLAQLEREVLKKQKQK